MGGRGPGCPGGKGPGVGTGGFGGRAPASSGDRFMGRGRGGGPMGYPGPMGRPGCQLLMGPGWEAPPLPPLLVGPEQGGGPPMGPPLPRHGGLIHREQQLGGEEVFERHRSPVTSPGSAGRFLDEVRASYRTYGNDPAGSKLKISLISHQVEEFIQSNPDISSPTGRTKDFVVCIRSLERLRHKMQGEFEDQVAHAAISYANRMSPTCKLPVSDSCEQGEGAKESGETDHGTAANGMDSYNLGNYPDDMLRHVADSKPSPSKKTRLEQKECFHDTGLWGPAEDVECFQTSAEAEEAIGPSFRHSRTRYYKDRTSKGIEKRITQYFCSRSECECKKEKVVPVEGKVEVHTFGSCNHKVSSWLEEKRGVPPLVKEFVLECCEKVLGLNNGSLDMVSATSIFYSASVEFNNHPQFQPEGDLGEMKRRIKMLIKNWKKKTKKGRRLDAKVPSSEGEDVDRDLI